MQNRKIAFVSGGSRGLGRDMALNLAANQQDVIFSYHQNKAAADQVKSEIEALGVQAHAIQLDSRDLSSFDRFIDQLSSILKNHFDRNQLDAWVNNAGTGIYKSFAETSEADFDEMMNIHFKGVYFLTQKALPLIKDSGSIVNISSGLARFSFPGSSAYASMKGAIEVFTRYLAKELGPRGIRANVVAPGAIATDFGGGSNRDDEQKRQHIANITALGRVGEAEDIGSVVAFLCSEASHWLTAQRIEASGGTLI
tara:strand:- start:222 stop:983 length:762 start_codon:yes stop_codon:yes gene_type:complete